jgi:sulfite reductase beta subunit-like hemoprotein
MIQQFRIDKALVRCQSISALSKILDREASDYLEVSQREKIQVNAKRWCLPGKRSDLR